jgi:hypothetical protein
MSLVFQERADGYRVVRPQGGTEVMVAGVQTRQPVYSGDPGYQVLLDAYLDEVRQKSGTQAMLAAAKSAENARPTLYVLLPPREWTVHGAGPPIPVAELEEIIAFALKAQD